MSVTSEDLNKSAWMKKALGVEVSPVRRDLDSGFPSTPSMDRAEAERAAMEFVRNHFIEHGTFPKWELLLKDPKFAAAVEAEGERIRAEAAREIAERLSKERQLMERLQEERLAVQKRNEQSKKAISSFVGNKTGVIDIEASGPVLRQGVCSLSPSLTKKFAAADEVCQRLFGHPVQIKPPLPGMRSPISYKDGVIYLNPTCPRGQLVGGVIFELNNAVKAQTFKKIEGDGESGAIMTSSAQDYGITDPGAIRLFNELRTPAERRALAQEYVEWEHMMNGTIREQLEVAKGMALEGADADWANYITTVCKGASDGTWATFEGYFNDPDGNQHYQTVLSAIRESSKVEGPTSSVVKEAPVVDLRGIASRVLGEMRGKVPGGKLEATISQIIKLGTAGNEIDDADSFEMFARRMAKKITKGAFRMAERDFSEEEWDGWMKE